MANLPVDMGTSDGSPHSTPSDHLDHHVKLHKAFNGLVSVSRFTLAHNTAGIDTGVTLWTPEVGDQII